MTVEFIVLAAFFGFVALAVLVVGYFFVMRAKPEAAAAGSIFAGPGLVQEPTLQDSFVHIMRRVGQAFPTGTTSTPAARRQLEAAGFRWEAAPQVLFGIKYAGALFLAGLGGSAATQTGQGISTVLVGALCLGGFGFLIPDRVLEVMVRRRSERLRRALPAALDLLVLGLEAGQSVDQAMLETSRSLRKMHPDLSAELYRVHLESRASKSRLEAFRHLAQRNRQPDLTKLVNLMIDSDRFGTSIAPALRTHARYLRTRFRQRAQEAARKVSVKLIFPVFFLILPSVLLVTLGPAVLQMKQQLESFLR
ncbi:MAG: type II secretion system F family protein [Acidobacteriales bacterium]|nr:type II secretion system F family protein [Terriglobales bacterium]